METFLSVYAEDDRGAPETSVEVRVDVPQDLKALVASLHGNRYANGFFQFAPNEKLAPYLALWNLNPAECFAFIRCGFGHVIFHHQKQYKVLNPVFNCTDILGEDDDVDFVLDTMLCDRAIMESSFFLDVYEQAFPKLGAPAPDEIYAFVPALGLGGTRDIAQVEKLKMGPEMALLSKL